MEGSQYFQIQNSQKNILSLVLNAFLPFSFIFCHVLQFLLIRIRIGNDHQFSSWRSATADTNCPRFSLQLFEDEEPDRFSDCEAFFFHLF